MGWWHSLNYFKAAARYSIIFIIHPLSVTPVSWPGFVGDLKPVPGTHQSRWENSTCLKCGSIADTHTYRLVNIGTLPTCMILESRRKPESPEETHTYRRNGMQKSTQKQVKPSILELWNAKVTLCTTMPMWYKLTHHESYNNEKENMAPNKRNSTFPMISKP